MFQRLIFRGVELASLGFALTVDVSVQEVNRLLQTAELAEAKGIRCEVVDLQLGRPERPENRALVV